MKLSNKTYNVIKWIVITASPALVYLLVDTLPLYGVTAETVNVIIKTISALTTFVGTCIGISSINYAKEKLNESESK